MTEKRFEWDDINIAIIDTQNRKKYWIDVTCIDEIVDLLNSLDEKYVDEFILCETLQHELQRVENENEKLKQQINELQFNKALGQQEYQKRVFYD